ncbi:uncharacterized protein [Polyergus mexicanus]|uniref:uncharacterized protein n=1 Tax=Polyergus mexicanus TaxID=615972 RepID=UPI0038B4CAA1
MAENNAERNLREQSARVNSIEEYIAWEQRCDEYIESLEEQSRIKRPRLSIGIRQLLIARRLEGLKHSLRTRFVHMGAGRSMRQHGLIWREIDTAFESRILTGPVINHNHIEPCQFFEDAKDIVLEHVQTVLKKHFNVKINTVFNGEFVTGDKRVNKSINTRNYELFRTSDLREWYERRVVEPTLASLEEFQERDSGWALSRILDFNVNINKYNPLRAGCHIKLPREITMKRAVINVQSNDNACFAWSVVAALYPAERNADRESSYPHYTTVLNLQDIEFPVTVNQIKKFELANDISINIYSIEEKNIIPIRLSELKKDKHVNLLYMEDNNVGHFAWIKNLSRLVSSRLSKKGHKKYICDRYRQPTLPPVVPQDLSLPRPQLPPTSPGTSRQPISGGEKTPGLTGNHTCTSFREWTLHPIELAPVEFTRPPRFFLSQWDIRVRRYTSPSTPWNLPPPLLSPLAASPLHHRDSWTQSQPAIRIHRGTQYPSREVADSGTQSDSDWETNTQEAATQTGTDREEPGYTHPRTTPTLPSSPELLRIGSFHVTKAEPRITWRERTPR